MVRSVIVGSDSVHAKVGALLANISSETLCPTNFWNHVYDVAETVFASGPPSPNVALPWYDRYSRPRGKAGCSTDNTSKKKPGPDIHGKATITSIFPTVDLAHSAFLPNLVHTINAAFNAAHAKQPELLLRSQGERLGSTDEFLANLSTDPESFVLIISYPGSDEVISTASYRRYYGPATDRPVDRNTPWLRTLDVDPDTEEWELKLMATDVKCQGYGLAGYMMKVGEEEIEQRFRQKLASGCGSGANVPQKLKMIICTPLELTGQFYLQRGYTLDYKTWRGEGYSFHIAFMHRMIELG